MRLRVRIGRLKRPELGQAKIIDETAQTSRSKRTAGKSEDIDIRPEKESIRIRRFGCRERELRAEPREALANVAIKTNSEYPAAHAFAPPRSHPFVVEATLFATAGGFVGNLAEKSRNVRIGALGVPCSVEARHEALDRFRHTTTSCSRAAKRR